MISRLLNVSTALFLMNQMVEGCVQKNDYTTLKTLVEDWARNSNHSWGEEEFFLRIYCDVLPKLKRSQPVYAQRLVCKFS